MKNKTPADMLLDVIFGPETKPMSPMVVAEKDRLEEVWLNLKQKDGKKAKSTLLARTAYREFLVKHRFSAY